MTAGFLSTEASFRASSRTIGHGESPDGLGRGPVWPPGSRPVHVDVFLAEECVAEADRQLHRKRGTGQLRRRVREIEAALRILDRRSRADIAGRTLPRNADEVVIERDRKVE